MEDSGKGLVTLGPYCICPKAEGLEEQVQIMNMGHLAAVVPTDAVDAVISGGLTGPVPLPDKALFSLSVSADAVSMENKTAGDAAPADAIAFGLADVPLAAASPNALKRFPMSQAAVIATVAFPAGEQTISNTPSGAAESVVGQDTGPDFAGETPVSSERPVAKTRVAGDPTVTTTISRDAEVLPPSEAMMARPASPADLGQRPADIPDAAPNDLRASVDTGPGAAPEPAETRSDAVRVDVDRVIVPVEDPTARRTDMTRDAPRHHQVSGKASDSHLLPKAGIPKPSAERIEVRFIPSGRNDGGIDISTPARAEIADDLRFQTPLAKPAPTATDTAPARQPTPTDPPLAGPVRLSSAPVTPSGPPAAFDASFSGSRTPETAGDGPKIQPEPVSAPPIPRPTSPQKMTPLLPTNSATADEMSMPHDQRTRSRDDDRRAPAADRTAPNPARADMPTPAQPALPTVEALRAPGDPGPIQPDPISEVASERSEVVHLATSGRSESVARLPDFDHRPVQAARSAASQIAEAVRLPNDGTVEIRLSPEELGRVKLSMVPGDVGMIVQLVAERAETLDLLRRHVDLLATDLQDLGYSGLEFSFSSEDREAPDQDRAPGWHGAKSEEAKGGHHTARIVPSRGLAPDGSLDIRL